MKPDMERDPTSEGLNGTRTRTRRRRLLPALETRDWMTSREVALALGCGVATVHRMRRGLIAGIEPLPSCQYGRKIVFRKVSIACWRERNETGGLAADTVDTDSGISWQRRQKGRRS
jgi:hypothetical protein